MECEDIREENVPMRKCINTWKSNSTTLVTAYGAIGAAV